MHKPLTPTLSRRERAIELRDFAIRLSSMSDFRLAEQGPWHSPSVLFLSCRRDKVRKTTPRPSP
jgi:hypothetical protein